MKNVIEGNKLIAEFMELKRSDLLPDSFLLDGVTRHASELQYHSSWDWLMPVVFKIREIELREMKASAVNFAFTIGYRTMTIETVWQAVTQFIQWYNSNIKK